MALTKADKKWMDKMDAELKLVHERLDRAEKRVKLLEQARAAADARPSAGSDSAGE